MFLALCEFRTTTEFESLQALPALQMVDFYQTKTIENEPVYFEKIVSG